MCRTPDASAVAAAAIGSACMALSPMGMAAAPSATAAPACSHWRLESNAFMYDMRLSNGQTASFQWDESGVSLSPQAPNALLDLPNGDKYSGNAYGGIVGGNKIDFTVVWTPEQGDRSRTISSRFQGNIENDTVADGIAEDNKKLSIGWKVTAPFQCADAPPPAPEPAPAPAAAPAPAPEPAKVAPTNAIILAFDRDAITWTANVTSSADLPGNCTYKASNPVLPGVNKSFTIDPNGTASFPVLAPPAFSTYHVVVSCHGTFDGKDVEFGHVEQDVSL
jgi:hypothetical protein